MLKVNKKTVMGIAAVALIGTGGIAYAYWTTGGGGTGTVATGTSTDLVVNQTSTLDPMFPGDAPQTLSGDFDNSASTMHVANVTVSIDSVTQGDVVAVGCTAADYTVTGATMAAVQEVPTGDGVGAWTGATIQFNNTTANQDPCKGATVNLAYAVG
jgi:hypothetical protein